MVFARRLYFLQYAIRPSNGAPVPGYLIQTVDGNGLPLNILVDTGFPASMIRRDGAPDPRNWLVTEEDSVLSRLAAIGLAPRDIGIVVCTHLDPDHAGSHDLFAGAEFIAQRRHYDAARTSGAARFGMPAAKWNDPRLHYRLIEGDVDLAPGVRLIESSGHVPAHQSVLVRLERSGAFVLAIDAIPFGNQLDPDTRPIGPYDMDEAEVRESTRKLVALAASEGAQLIHGHDGIQWARLRKSPEFYD